MGGGKFRRPSRCDMQTDPGNNDEKLSGLLQEWRTEVSLPPRFQEGVWQRIERAETPTKLSGWPAIVRWIGQVLPRPALAASYIVILFTFGLTAGWAEARHTTSHVKNELGDRYVQSLDPYQTPRK